MPVVLNRSLDTDVSFLAHTPQIRSNNTGVKDNYFSRTLCSTNRNYKGYYSDHQNCTYRCVFMCFLQFREVLKVFWQ